MKIIAATIIAFSISLSSAHAAPLPPIALPDDVVGKTTEQQVYDDRNSNTQPTKILDCSLFAIMHSAQRAADCIDRGFGGELKGTPENPTAL